MDWSALRRWLLKLSLPMTKAIGKMHAPLSHRLIHAADYRQAMEVLKPGMPLISRCRAELSNVPIPGFYTHAAIYIGNGVVIEAVGQGVKRTDLIDFMMTKDYVCILTPTFANPTQMDLAVSWAISIIGSQYDYLFEISKGVEKAFYCAELISWSYAMAMKPLPCPFVLRETLGVQTVIPQDFYDAVTKFNVVWESQKGAGA